MVNKMETPVDTANEKKNETKSLTHYSLPDNIEFKEKEKEVVLRSNAGEFHMPAEIFELYYEKFAINPSANNFPRFIVHFLKTDSVNNDSILDKLRRKVRDYLISRGLTPEDYFDEHGRPTEKMSELKNLFSKELLDDIIFYEISDRFTSHTVDDKLNYFEHDLMAGTSEQFWGHPFMGAFKADPAWQKNTREKRQQFLKEAMGETPQAIILFTNRKNYQYAGTNQYLAQMEAGTDELRNKVRDKLKAFFQSNVDGKILWEDIDYARIVLKCVEFDENMEAIPQPLKLEFLGDKKVIATIDDPRVIKNFGLQRDDWRLADTLEDSKGKKYQITIDTNGFVHTLKFADKPLLDWYNAYLTRISQ